MNPVRIGIIDSGVNPQHPHIGNLVEGIGIGPAGESPDSLDVLGHGTAVAALIHWKAPHATLVPVRVFERGLATNIDILLRAIEWCAANRISIVNLSLGTTNPRHETAMLQAVARARAAGCVIVSAAESAGTPALPGMLPGVIAVAADATCEGDTYQLRLRGNKPIFHASPYPRSIPGVPVHRNLQGASFAVAHITAWIARLWPAFPAPANWEQALQSALTETHSI